MSLDPKSIANILTALDAGAALLARGVAWNTAVRDAVQEGRDLNDAEMDALREADDVSDVRLVAAIAAKRQREAQAAAGG